MRSQTDLYDPKEMCHQTFSHLYRQSTQTLFYRPAQVVFILLQADTYIHSDVIQRLIVVCIHSHLRRDQGSI